MTEILPVLITAAVTVFGWYATYSYAKIREDRTRRLDLLIKLRAQQIEQLYGPLLSLIEQIFNVWQVQENVLRGTSYAKDDQRKIRDFFWRHYFTPLHQEIRALLKTNPYLLEGGRIPESSTEYLEHATQEACQHRLWSELGIDTSKVKGRQWPQMFYKDVKSALDELMNDYQSGLARLK
jgi:hypothetical protein